LEDAVDAGLSLPVIFKEPTITPTNEQVESMGLSKKLCSPNGYMRSKWNGFTISRDTIRIEGIETGYNKPVFFDRHAVGGEYNGKWGKVGKGLVKTYYFPDDESTNSVEISSHHLKDDNNVVVTYFNPLDNVEDMSHHFFSRCLKANITPYVVTKKTVFGWQEEFWQIMKDVFDKNYKEDFIKKDLLENCGDDLRHLISDAATMSLVSWSNFRGKDSGGFGMATHNYDGDMLSDELSQIYRSPGFITSCMVGKNNNSKNHIKLFEASHGTVTDMWNDHLNGKETSINPIGMVEGLMRALEYSNFLHSGDMNYHVIDNLRNVIYGSIKEGYGTRDLFGKYGLTTEEFIDHVAKRL